MKPQSFAWTTGIRGTLTQSIFVLEKRELFYTSIFSLGQLSVLKRFIPPSRFACGWFAVGSNAEDSFSNI